jgi:hypothetical protein
MGTFMTVGLTMIVTVGSISSEIITDAAQEPGQLCVVAIFFVHGSPTPCCLSYRRPCVGRHEKKDAPPPDPSTAGRQALRSLAIVFPMALLFLFMSGSPAYTVVMIKVATMGQQATADHSRAMGRSLLESTLWGGVGAVIGWNVLSIWPSPDALHPAYRAGRAVFRALDFRGQALHPKSQMASYAFLTLVVILAPAALDGAGSSGAGPAFWSRLGLFVLIAVYGTVAVRVFDAFWPGPTGDSTA